MGYRPSMDSARASSTAAGEKTEDGPVARIGGGHWSALQDGGWLSGPERIDLGLVGLERTDLLYSTPDHNNNLRAGRVQPQPIALACCAMDGHHMPLAGGDVQHRNAQRASP